MNNENKESITQFTHRNTCSAARYAGFTLVEMLAVVIIVGILTAVAVPQYRRGIQKAQATEAMHMLRIIYDSSERLAATMGYKSFHELADADPDRATFSHMDMFGDVISRCTVDNTLLDCQTFIYDLNPDGDFIIATKQSTPYQDTQIRFYRQDIPFLRCCGNAAACDVYNLDVDEEC